MSYNKFHTEEDCDRCLKEIGKDKLLKVPFLYKDWNDRVHRDENGRGYRQYYVCERCYNESIGAYRK